MALAKYQSRGWQRFRRDRWGSIALWVVFAYLLIAVGVWLGIWGTDWAVISGGKWESASAEHWFGTNLLGQDIFQRTIYATKTAFEIGLLVAVSSTLLGAVLGAISGYFSNTWIDEVILWLKGVLDAIPFYLFVAAVAFAFKGAPYAMHLAMISTFWTTTGRVVRGEVIKLKQQDFVTAARAMGLGHWLLLFRHILPNTSHLLLVQGTIVFVSAIKSEVILSFLGLGTQNGVSWGLMLEESTQEVTAGHFANFLAASAFLFVLVMAFNAVSDALQDALDPKQVSI